MTNTPLLKKRVCLDIDLDRWSTIERLAKLARRDSREHAAVLLEQLAAKEESRLQEKVA